MKKIYLFVIVAFLISTVLYLVNLQNGNILGIKKKDNPIVTPTPLVMPENTVEVNYKDREYWISWMKVREINKLFLYPNYSEKETSRSLIEKYKCQKLVNGGFYTKDDQPLGLFISEGMKLKDKTKNITMNGIFFASYEGGVGILPDFTENRTRFAVQTGPILIDNRMPKKLFLPNDIHARRMVVGLTEENEVVFLAFYNKDMPFGGPFLSDLPDILSRFQDKTGIRLVKALNLDGGSASAFYNGSFFLEELSYIGSYFCLR